MVPGWKSDARMGRGCGYTIVNSIVLAHLHFSQGPSIWEALGSLLEVILGGFGDLWVNFCDFVVVQKTIEIPRWILEAKMEK